MKKKVKRQKKVVATREWLALEAAAGRRARRRRHYLGGWTWSGPPEYQRARVARCEACGVACAIVILSRRDIDGGIGGSAVVGERCSARHEAAA